MSSSSRLQRTSSFPKSATKSTTRFSSFWNGQHSWHRIVVLLVLTILLYLMEERLGLHSVQNQIWLFGFIPVFVGVVWLPTSQVLLLSCLWFALPILEAVRTPEILQTAFIFRLSALAVMMSLCIWISSQRQVIQMQRRLLMDKANRLEIQSQQLSEQLATTRRAAALAHEIRQPLTIIQMGSRRLLDQIKELDNHIDASIAASADLLHRTSADLNTTIGAMANLLRSARSELARIDVASVVLSAIEGLQLQLERAGVQLSLNGLDHSQPMLGDAEQLRIATLNLIRNAIDVLKGLPRESRRIDVTLECHGDVVCLHVSDSGPGLPKPLHELMELGSVKTSGMGQGLFIAQRIAANHHGGLDAHRSVALGGADICLTLPRGC